MNLVQDKSCVVYMDAASSVVVALCDAIANAHETFLHCVRRVMRHLNIASQQGKKISPHVMDFFVTMLDFILPCRSEDGEHACLEWNSAQMTTRINGRGCWASSRSN